MRPRIPSAPLRPIVQNYLDNYETADVQKIGNWTARLSAVIILAEEADVPERSLRHFLAGTYETIEFDRADRLLCAMGLGTLGWQSDPELWDSYCNADLSLYERGREPRARSGFFKCGCPRSEENSKPSKKENGKQWFTCRKHYNENKRLKRLNYGRVACS